MTCVLRICSASPSPFKFLFRFLEDILPMAVSWSRSKFIDCHPNNLFERNSSGRNVGTVEISWSNDLLTFDQRRSDMHVRKPDGCTLVLRCPLEEQNLLRGG